VKLPIWVMNFLSGSDATGSQGQRCTADGCCSLSCCKKDCTCLDPCDLMRQTAAQRHHGEKVWLCSPFCSLTQPQIRPSVTHTLAVYSAPASEWTMYKYKVDYVAWFHESMMYCDIRNKENYIMTIVTLDVM